jgi:hypothetical protein
MSYSLSVQKQGLNCSIETHYRIHPLSVWTQGLPSLDPVHRRATTELNIICIIQPAMC